MTSNKHFKQLVRARMTATGESYAAASDQVSAARADISLTEAVVADVHGRHGQCVTFTPDGTRILSGGQDARIVVLDAATGAVEGELVGHEKVVNAVEVIEDATTVVSTSSDRTVRIWDLSSRTQTAVLEGHTDAVVALDVSPDGSTAITAGYDGRVRVWDLHRRGGQGAFESDLERISSLAYAGDGALFVEAGQGPTVHVRRSSDGEVVGELDTGAPGVIGLAVSREGAMLATAAYDGTVSLWGDAGWDLVRRLRAGERANAVTFSRSGQLLAAAASRRVVVWSHEQDEPVAETDLPITGVYALAFSPDARRLAQTGADGKVRIWTLR